MSANRVTDILAVQHAEAILQWYLDNGVDEAVVTEPVDRLAMKPLPKFDDEPKAAEMPVKAVAPTIGAVEAKADALKLVESVTTLEELKTVISAFEGLALKKTAMKMVFADGSPSASVMVISDAPEAEDDRLGVPFSGEVGQLTDKMFAAIGLSRSETDAAKSIYLTNILNWRPPGNRSPQAAEIEISMVFLRKHIELIKPKVIYLMGAVASRAVLETEQTVTKLRGTQHSVKVGDFECPAFVSFSPSFLLKSPLKKREAWEDLQALKAHLQI